MTIEEFKELREKYFNDISKIIEMAKSTNVMDSKEILEKATKEVMGQFCVYWEKMKDAEDDGTLDKNLVNICIFYRLLSRRLSNALDSLIYISEKYFDKNMFIEDLEDAMKTCKDGYIENLKMRRE